MVASQQLAREHVARGLVHLGTVNLAAAVDDAVLTDKMLVFRRDVVLDRERRLRAQLAAQVSIRRMDEELKGLRRVVAEAVVEVVVEDRRAGAERHLTAKVGEQVELVVVVLLGDGQRRVEHHPVDEVAELAHPAADSFVGLRIGVDETCAVAACGAGRPDETPERKRFARTDEDAVDLRCGERKVDGFVVLQHRIDLAERAADEGIVAVDERGKRRFRARFGKVLTGCDVAQRAERAAFLNRNAVRER